MFRQVGIGAAAVLTIGLLAAGCGSDGDTIITGGGNLLNNQDSTPFSGVTNNNLAPDGGGFSANGSNANGFTVTFNCDSAKSDGTFAGDDSAIVLFTLANNRVYASYFSGGTFTPPVELEAPDRDYGTGVSNAGSLAGYVCMPLNTGQYQSGNATPATEVNTVRQNDGNWLIIGDFVTSFVLPGQTQDNASSLGKGARRTIASWVFLKDESGNSLSTSSAVGTTTREFRYGFQRSGDEIATSHTTGAVGAAPANNVMSYGVASDGICGQASWTGNNTTPFTGAQAGPSSVSNATNLGNNYAVGEAVSNLTVLFTQIETTLSSDSDQLRRNTQDAATSRGEGLFLRYRNFNLATMTWGTEARIQTGIDVNTGTGSTEAGSGVYSDFHTYNNTVFYRYMDASMRVNNTTNFTVDSLNIQSRQDILAATRFTDQGNGTATQAGTIDVSTDAFCVNVSNGAGTPGAHHTTVAATSGTSAGAQGSLESSNFFAYTGSSNTQSIYGSDEGLGDMTLFYSLADGTNNASAQRSTTSAATGSSANSDAELAVVALPSAGTLATSSLTTGFGTNPLRISGDHATDGQQLGTNINNNLTDPISTPSFAMNRTGTWIGVAFTRLQGVTQGSNFQRNLYANIYQTFRIVASTTAAGQTGGVAATMQNRVLAAGPTVVDSPTSGSLNAAAPNGTEIPVNAFAWQGKACYRGWQSDRNIMSLFFEQSDATGDRVFGARLSVTVGGSSTAPTAPTLANPTVAELAFANNVLGDAAFFTTAGAPGTSSFEWLNGNGRVTNSAAFASCDSGLDNNGAGGSVYVTFSRVNDGTTTDSGTNDLGDVSIYSTIFSGAFETPVQIGTTADTNEAIAGIAAATNISLLSVDCLPNNTDIANKPDYPSTGDSTFIVTTMQDRDGSTLTTASGATTPTVVSGNASGLLVPMFRVLRATNATATPALNSIDTRMNPSVVNTTTSPFVMPVRLAHEAGLSTNLGSFSTCQTGSILYFLLEINSQIWFQTTTGDTAEVLREGSSQQVNPGLVSNFTGADVLGGFNLTCCTNGNGDATAAALQWRKADSAGTTQRHYVANAQF
jgi:hypothetical protein